MAQSNKLIKYKASPTAEKFHQSLAFFRGLMGPVGSGKSVACCFDILDKSCKQEPDSEGIRPSRVLVVRNTFPELKSTTIKTWADWFPPTEKGKPGLGVLKWGSPITHHVRFPLPDGTSVELDVEFLALDKDSDVKKLLSYEVSGIWFNEARELGFDLVQAATGRVGRYPSPRRVSCTRPFMIADTNPPREDHWWFKAAEIKTPKGWEFFKQPGGRDVDAENLENLTQPPNFKDLSLEERRKHGRKYYEKQVASAESQGRHDIIHVMVDGNYGSMQSGQPVFNHVFNRNLHVAKQEIPILPKARVHIGIDSSGRHPAAVFLQEGLAGQWQVVGELTTMDPNGMGARAFAKRLAKEIATNYRECDLSLEVWGDPAGAQKSSTEEKSYFDILNEVLRVYGLWMVASPGYRIPERLETIRYVLSELTEGQPRIIISPVCKNLIRGLEGEYKYQEQENTDGEEKKKPLKNRYSDVQDALQYVLCGVGEMHQMLGHSNNLEAFPETYESWNPFEATASGY